VKPDTAGGTTVMSRDIVPTCPGTSFHVQADPFMGWKSRLGSRVSSRSWLPVFGQHPHVEVGNVHQNAAPGEPASQPDVVQPGVVTNGDDPGGVDLLPSDPVVRGDHHPGS